MKTILVIDNNLGLDHAVKLAKGYKVFYCPGGSGAYPYLRDQISGDGFPLTYVEDFGSESLDVDMVVIVDCFLGGLADSLRKKGVSVFGPSAEWTRIENDRVHGWQALKGMGIGVPDGEVVMGMKGVLDYVGAHEDKTEKDPLKKRRFFLKVGKYRGNFPTKDVATVLEAQAALTQADFGPYVDSLWFLVNDMSPGIEVGFDAFFNGTEFIRPFAYTIEIKGSGTTARWIDTNGIETEFFEKMQKSLADSGYRGNISMEFLWDGKKVRAMDSDGQVEFPLLKHPGALYLEL